VSANGSSSFVTLPSHNQDTRVTSWLITILSDLQWDVSWYTTAPMSNALHHISTSPDRYIAHHHTNPSRQHSRLPSHATAPRASGHIDPTMLLFSSEAQRQRYPRTETRGEVSVSTSRSRDGLETWFWLSRSRLGLQLWGLVYKLMFSWIFAHYKITTSRHSPFH